MAGKDFLRRQQLNSINETHDPRATSWVPRSGPLCDFPIQNLPFGRFASPRLGASRVGVAIGDAVVDLQQLATKGSLSSPVSDALNSCQLSDLREIMGLPRSIMDELRRDLFRLLEAGAPTRIRTLECLEHRGNVRMLLPVRPSNFTDFFASIDHARNAGRMRRPDNPLPPNFEHIPVAYHSRASTVQVCGHPLRRPHGQWQESEGGPVVFGQSQKMDFECEVAAWIGCGNEQGVPIKLAEAEAHVFGLGLLNDWSARDIQMWESQPLGPFLSKNFLTSVSPWIVTISALAPYRSPAPTRTAAAPPALPYLVSGMNQRYGGFDLKMSVRLSSLTMRSNRQQAGVLSKPLFRRHYWTVAQMVAHHTSNGCSIEPGDLFGSGTVSGPTPDEFGCLLELNQCGKEPLHLHTGERRMWLEDGDEVILSAHCERDGFARIGFGEVRGQILPAIPY